MFSFDGSTPEWLILAREQAPQSTSALRESMSDSPDFLRLAYMLGVFAMHTHFCPQCGQALKQSDCKREARSRFFSRFQCTRCGVAVQESGGIIFVTGFAFAIIGSLLGHPGVVLVIGGLALCALGIMRLLRQFRAARLYASKHHDA